MSEDSLELAINEPARRVGLELEPGLVATMVRDVAGEPGGLPLLQYALTELVEQSPSRRLSVDDYLRIGAALDGDPRSLAERRSRQRSRMAASPPSRTSGYARRAGWPAWTPR